jgi:putative hydrolase of the HAD superfamily
MVAEGSAAAAAPNASYGAPVYGALLLDIGDVITAAVFDQLDELEQVLGTTLVGRGPLDPAGDPLWQRYLNGELTFVGYWKQYASAAGYDDWKQLFRDLVEHVPDRFSDPDAVALMTDAKAAGYKVAVLTNDGIGIAGREFFAGRIEFAALDAFIDAREFGEAKPAPAPYLRAAKELDLSPGEIVFLDDTPECVDGARAVGMTGVLVDPLDKDAAFVTTRSLLGLGPISRTRALVRRADDAWSGNDLEATMAMFDADVIVYWNGTKMASGAEQTRRFHLDRLGWGSTDRDETSRRTYRAAEGDTIATEWERFVRHADGTLERFVAGELWSMRGDRVIEWTVHTGAAGAVR